jgi:hypothetical protein
MNSSWERPAGWIKNHKLVLSLCAIIFLLLYWNNRYQFPRPFDNSVGIGGGMMSDFAPAAEPMMMERSTVSGKTASIGIMPPIYQPQSTDLYQSDRKVVRNSDLSLLVKDVRSAIDQIESQAKSIGGFMVNSSVQTPEEGGTGSIVIRVPAEKLDSTLAFLRGVAVRVVSENVTGSDITDQYTDTEARLATLTQTKATFESILSKASDVDEIIKVQHQIDSLKGQLEYLKNTSQSSLITVYLSTDELALPYSPSEPWRPQIVFKTAVRSLVTNLRSVANVGIWAVAWSPVIIVVAIVLWFIKRKMMK